MPKASETNLPNSTTGGVQVFTWGTDTESGNGVFGFADAKLFGGNVGHAAIKITFPANEEGKKLIGKYCGKDSELQYKEKTITTNGIEEKVYEVYWSWWPAEEKEAFFMESSIKEDMKAENIGHHTEWSEAWKKKLKPEERKHTGILGTRTITSGIKNIVHQRELDEGTFHALRNKAQVEDAMDTIKALKLLETRIRTQWNHSVNQPGKTEILILNRFFSGWEKKVSNVSSITESESKILLNKVARLRGEYQEEIHKIRPMIVVTEPKEVTDVKKTIATLKEYQVVDNLNFTEPEREQVINCLKNLKEIISAKDESEGEDIARLIEKFEDPESMDKALVEDILLELDFRVLSIEDTRTEAEKTEIEEMLEESHVVSGRPPDGVVSLPIAPVRAHYGIRKASDLGAVNGLDVEAMLGKMQELTTTMKEGFNLYTKNCSATVNAILESGVQQEYQKDFFRTKALGFFGTPQEAYNNAMKFQTYINKGEPGIFKKITAWNPIERMGGALIAILLDKSFSNSGLKKTGAMVGLIVLSPFAVVSFVSRKLMNPLKSFNGAKNLISYAFSRNSTGLKALAVVTMVPLVVLLAGPAGIQKIVNVGVVNPIAGIAGWVKKTFNKAGSVEPEDSSEKAIKEKNKKVELSETIAGITVYVKAKNPKEALEEFEHYLMVDKNAIPVFSKETQDRILKYIADTKHPERRALYAVLMEMAAKRVTDAQRFIKDKEPVELTAESLGAAQPVKLIFTKSQARTPELIAIKKKEIKKGIQALTVHIKAEKPEKALFQFKKCLLEDKNAIPVFDKKVEELLEKYVNSKEHAADKTLYDLFKRMTLQRKTDAKKAVKDGHPLQLFHKKKEVVKETKGSNLDADKSKHEH